MSDSGVCTSAQYIRYRQIEQERMRFQQAQDTRHRQMAAARSATYGASVSGSASQYSMLAGQAGAALDGIAGSFGPTKAVLHKPTDNIQSTIPRCIYCNCILPTEIDCLTMITTIGHCPCTSKSKPKIKLTSKAELARTYKLEGNWITEPETLRQKLQKETNEWLKGIKIEI